MTRLFSNSTVRGKVMLVVLSTTFAALLLAAAALVGYELRNYEKNRVGEVASLATILGRASGPALTFDDAKAGRENLALLGVRPLVNYGALYRPNGSLFAAYSAPDNVEPVPGVAPAEGYAIKDGWVLLTQRIVENDEVLGSVFISSRYEPLERLKDYLSILGGVMLAAASIAVLLSLRLQRTVTQPILDIASVAREVMAQRDFSLRAPTTSGDEIGTLSVAFNGMLSEVENRATALEESNRTLEHEMHERLEAEQALIEADRRKDEFLATLAHELRNPLAPLRTGLDILRVQADPALAEKARDMMERQLRQMVRLVDDLLDVSRITTGKLAIHRHRIELQAVIRNALETAQPFIVAHRQTLEVKLPPEPLYLDGDATRLAQVFYNLLNNAAKYSEPGGHITLSAEADGGTVAVTVADGGIGISATMLPKIFDMFTQADHTLERTQAGLGVGLSLARSLVELHGGSIESFSDGPGRGSRFVVRLPRAGSSPGGAGDDMPASEAAANAGRRILLADDNADFADTLSELLTAMGHDVRVARNGEEALAVAAAFHPQFAFLDIGMPRLNGYELARRLRAAPDTATTVLTAVTGWGQKDDRRRAEEAGFDHHIVKPLEMSRLLSILSENLRGSRIGD